MLVKFSIYSLLECKTTCELFDLQLFFFRLLGFLQLKEPCNRSVLCQGFPRGGSEGMIHFSKPYQLHPHPHPHPLVTMPLCAAPTGPVPSLLQPTCEMLFCCLVPPQLEHLPLDPPLSPLCFSSIQPKQRLVLSATLCRLFSEDKQERETDRGCRGQWNSWLYWSSSFSISTSLMSCVSKCAFYFKGKVFHISFRGHCLEWCQDISLEKLLKAFYNIILNLLLTSVGRFSEWFLSSSEMASVYVDVCSLWLRNL